MSQDLENVLVKNSAPHLLISGKHRATDVVQFIISKVGIDVDVVVVLCVHGVCGVWCVVCGVWCVVCGVWCVVCGVWCVVCGV
jgi:hypothetical protein